ncbi:uncharacterized protein LOC131434999 isoform X2 [Malaya genurostris]|uniref:uncharacterized protein LOC131434999 isoform X2 n=1 Tax=Malaya genurostris TaxID=325434 RepID=UPI0026F3AC0E|nr:uncharacterized protein LOC131434999 isoform X2 [Malaya genurostris]
MNSEKRKLDLYLLLCQSAYALIVALLRAAQNGSPYIQAAIKQKMFQLAETLRLYLREQSFLPEPRTTPMTPGRTLGASRSIRDMSAAFNRSRFGQGAHSSAQFPSPAAAIRPQMKSDTLHQRTPVRPNIRTNPRGLNISTTSSSYSGSPKRFPILQRLLNALAHSADDSVYSEALGPVATDPQFTPQLLDEMTALRLMLNDSNSSRAEASMAHEKDLTDRLERMETSMHQLQRQFDRLETITELSHLADE